EQEDHVTDRPGDHPEEEQYDRQSHELDPAWDDDLRRPGGHADDRTAEVVHLRPPSWDWHWAEDGNLALDRHELWEEPLEDPRIPLSQTRPPLRLKDGAGFVTVPRMPAPSRRVPA